jgi:hypothetical protein
MTDEEKQKDALSKLRAPFDANHISKKPVPTKKQTEETRAGTVKPIMCQECGGYHHPKVQHLDYVGHAAITHRFLDVDPMWNWEPLATTSEGLPKLDADGGLWIKLTVAGITRLGYGDAGQKSGPDAMKERIGDALRNAGMRFGMALDLWHKGVLEMEPERFEISHSDKWVMKAECATSIEELQTIWQAGVKEVSDSGDRKAYDELKSAVNNRKQELAKKEGAQ